MSLVDRPYMRNGGRPADNGILVKGSVPGP